MGVFGFIAHTGELSELNEQVPSLLKKPEAQCKRALEALPSNEIIRIKNIRSKTGSAVEGIIASTWLLPEHYLTMPKHKVQKKILDAVRVLERRGATIVGLGGYNSIVPPGSGRIVAKNSKVAVTNGNTLTIAASVGGIDNAIRDLKLKKEELSITIVGATGSIGSVITSIIAKEPFKKITIVGRNMTRLEGKAKIIKNKLNKIIYVSNDVEKSVRDADIVISATSSPEKIIDDSWFKKNAIVCDVSFPHNIDKDIAITRKDVFYFEGGLVEMFDKNVYRCVVPHVNRSTKDLGKPVNLPRGFLFACMAETILLAMEDCEEHFSLDGIKVEKVEYMKELAQKHGFKVAPFKNALGIIDVNAFINTQFSRQN